MCAKFFKSKLDLIFEPNIKKFIQLAIIKNCNNKKKRLIKFVW